MKVDILHNPKDKDSSLQKFSDCNELLVTSTKTEFNLIEPMKFLQGCLINFKKMLMIYLMKSLIKKKLLIYYLIKQKSVWII